MRLLPRRPSGVGGRQQRHRLPRAGHGHHRPIDLLTGQRIDVGKALAWSNDKEFHHFFPQGYLKGQGVERNKINCLANFVMLTSESNVKILSRPPSVYLGWVEEAAGDQLDDWLASNLLTHDAFDAAKRDDYDAYLELRARALHDALLPYAGWDIDRIAPTAAEEVDADGASRADA